MSLQESTEPLLHPRQVQELREERSKFERMLAAPPHVRNQLADGGAQAQRRIQDIDKMLQQAPKPYAPEELDAAVREEKQLREEWLNGMPTQAEMRRNPAGAVDKHRAWEKRSKDAVLKWKRVRRRLHASGISEHGLDDESAISNIERYRPAGGSFELNMHNEQIEGKTIHGPVPGAGPAAVMSDEQAAVLKEINPDLHANMALMSNDQRRDTLEIVDKIITSRAREAELTGEKPVEAMPKHSPSHKTPKRKPKPKGKGKKRMSLSPEERERRREQGKRLAAAQKAKREAEASQTQEV